MQLDSLIVFSSIPKRIFLLYKFCFAQNLDLIHLTLHHNSCNGNQFSITKINAKRKVNVLRYSHVIIEVKASFQVVFVGYDDRTISICRVFQITPLSARLGGFGDRQSMDYENKIWNWIPAIFVVCAVINNMGFCIMLLWLNAFVAKRLLVIHGQLVYDSVWWFLT